jgi:hypothetical protein
LSRELEATAQQLEDWADAIVAAVGQGADFPVDLLRRRARELWRLVGRLDRADPDAAQTAPPTTDYARRMAEHSARRQR